MNIFLIKVFILITETYLTGLGEDERLIWLTCISAWAEIHKVVQDITGVSMEFTGKHVQNIDQSPARQKRDEKDIKAILRFLVSRNPFINLKVGLRSISSGRIASNQVNAEKKFRPRERRFFKT